MSVHRLKTRAEYFEAVCDGSKTHEVRVNDRDFQVGDHLVLEEIGEDGARSGREIHARVTHMLAGFMGLSPGWVVLSLDVTFVAQASVDEAAHGWTWSTNEERWPSPCGFSSREEAVEEALASLEPGDLFWTGRDYHPSGKDFSLHGASVLEDVGMQAYEEVGEAAERWPMADKASERELGEKLSAVLAEWIDEHAPPDYWVARDVEQHTVPDGDAVNPTEPSTGGDPC